MKLYVGNLMYNMTDIELSNLFSTYGAVVNAQIITDHYTRQSKNFGYVKMSSRTAGKIALQNLHGKKINNRKIIVKEARPRDERMGLGW
ncbi:MAG: RNA-binding protein [Proteobacteria bacterium]|nr:RNA-binding protein [Pseudomonadota bacterium]MBU1710895.1 RNA-binding protein [Pseudomonadota bacterium]